MVFALTAAAEGASSLLVLRSPESTGGPTTWAALLEDESLVVGSLLCSCTVGGCSLTWRVRAGGPLLFAASPTPFAPRLRIVVMPLERTARLAIGTATVVGGLATVSGEGTSFSINNVIAAESAAAGPKNPLRREGGVAGLEKPTPPPPEAAPPLAPPLVEDMLLLLVDDVEACSFSEVKMDACAANSRRPCMRLCTSVRTLSTRWRRVVMPSLSSRTGIEASSSVERCSTADACTPRLRNARSLAERRSTIGGSACVGLVPRALSRRLVSSVASPCHLFTKESRQRAWPSLDS